MARRDLSRTVIEGGRSHFNQRERRHSHGIERASTRAWIATADVDDSAPPRRRPVAREPWGKGAPAKRWLDRQVGRPWDKVYSELCARFDRRTIAGAQLVDYMRGAVFYDNLSKINKYCYFCVDAYGILRRTPMNSRSWSGLRTKLLAWAGGLLAANTSMGWWWFRTSGEFQACHYPACRSTHQIVDGQRYHQRVAVRALSKGDLRRLARVPDELRSLVLMSR